MKTVITFGVFDWFHYGHLKLLQQAKSFGDRLIVAVQDGDCILRYKPQSKILYTTEQRLELVKELRSVDGAVVYRSVDEDIKNIDFDIFAVGEDQTHEGFRRAEKWCLENGKIVVRLRRTPNISSTDLKRGIE